MRIFIDSNVIEDGYNIIIWCYKGDENHLDAIWKTTKVTFNEIFKYANDNGLLVSVSNLVDHDGQHIQKVADINIIDQLDYVIKHFIESKNN